MDSRAWSALGVRVWANPWRWEGTGRGLGAEYKTNTQMNAQQMNAMNAVIGTGNVDAIAAVWKAFAPIPPSPPRGSIKPHRQPAGPAPEVVVESVPILGAMGVEPDAGEPSGAPASPKPEPRGAGGKAKKQKAHNQPPEYKPPTKKALKEPSPRQAEGLPGVRDRPDGKAGQAGRHLRVSGRSHEGARRALEGAERRGEGALQVQGAEARRGAPRGVDGQAVECRGNDVVEEICSS